MGKQKGERSKNRPSSSSLAASLLPSGASVIGFGGYLGSSPIDPPSSSEESTAFSDVDSEVAQHLKRLGRKDPTTKLKALASLCLLFKQKSGEELAQIVPQWAFEYKRLLLDYNREVRRATHDAMTSLVSTVRKGLVPHLKSLMGPWWFSQFDPIPEVSQSAKRSLEAAFPDSERRLDALMLSVNEIFLYLDENLKLTPQAMSDKATPMDELEDMHQRVISSSLLAVATLVDIMLGMKSQSSDSETVTTEQKLGSKARTATISSAEKMFSVHNLFLEFFKSKSPVIRSATYSVLTSFIKHIPYVFNEGNMKTVSAAILGVFQEKDKSCHSSMWDMLLLFLRKISDCWSYNNIQKVILSRFWNFLRHGCYGSQQISYPALVLFLESVPPAAVGGEQFVLNFFQNLWAGRNPLQSTIADTLAFFKAFKECFLWGLQNASRYNMSGDAKISLSIKLVSDILVTLLWQDYLLLVSLKSRDKGIYQSSDRSAEEGIQFSDERSTETFSSRYPMSYVEELGKCIIEILADISNKDFDLLSVFSTTFHKDCLEIFQQGEYQPKFPEHVERISNFFRLLDQCAWQKGQPWPLQCLAGPIFANSYKVIKTMNAPNAVRFLNILVEIFGPVTLFSYLLVCNEDQWSVNTIHDTHNETKANFFLQAFRDDFVPWCLDGHTCSSSGKLDLLIASVQDEFFLEQWCSIITYATDLDKCFETDIRTSNVIDQTEVLAILIGKVREKINKMRIQSVHKIGYLPEHWQHELLDSAAVSAALHSSSNISYARFLRAVLGGSPEDDKICFLSGAAVFSIFQQMLKILVIFLSTSSFEWARLSSSLLLSSTSMDFTQIQKSSFADKLKMAQFALEVLEGSIFCSKMLEENSLLPPCILAAIFIIDWECNMSSCVIEEDSSDSSKNVFDPDSSLVTSKTVLDDYSREQFDAKLTLGRRTHAFRHKIGASFCACLSSSNLSTLRSILVQTLRSAAFETNNLTSEEISSLCCEWMLDMLEIICHGQLELQSMLDQLLTEDSSWPLWVAPLLQDKSRSATIQVKRAHTGIKEVRHNQFIAFVEKLSSRLGFSKLIAGFDPQTPVSSAVTLTEHVSSFSSLYSRSWLAAELLCTWKWQGGSALDSFLPSLSTYAKCESSYPEVNVNFSIVNILFDGTLVQGTNTLWISFSTWIASEDEVDNIRDPFLRALTALLLILFVKEKVWRKHEALELFKNVVGRLFINTTLNMTCLRILPFILSILVEPLLLQSTEFGEASKDVLLVPWKDDSVLKNVLSWLQRALSFPPLGIGKSGEPDLEEWVQLIISCYPLRETGVTGLCKVEVVRDICHLEKPLLLSLFQKQRSGNYVYAAVSEMSSTASSSSQALVSFSPSQMILAKLLAVTVGYCWKEFSEDDWHFVLDNLQKWIESSVLLMEEMAEKIDELVVSCTSNSNLELIVEKLELAVLALDPMAINISSTALLVLSLFSQLIELQEIDRVEVLRSIKLGRWAQIEVRVMENILRLFFATGVAEAIASSCSDEASSIVASSRIAYSQFWGRVASFVINSPKHVRNTAVKSIELWGLSKGPISSLYAILFSSKSIPSLQFAAYRLISTEPLCHFLLLKKNFQVENTTASEDSNLNNFESSSEDSLSLVDEISFLIQKPAASLLEMELVSQDRANVFLAWAVLLSYLHSLSPSSSARETLIQYIQESVSSVILDCIFQNIPLKQGVNNIKKKDAELVAEASIAASAAKHVVSASSVLLSLETLWPVGRGQMASLAGSIYGMMIWLLPSYVSNWFTSMRDRALGSAIESFTKVWCSPSLVSNEMSQVKESVVADENFSVGVNKSAYEIIATYKKEETGMDLVIHLPSCYPLRPVEVDCTRSLGISEVKKRKWLLSLTAFIRNQNGAISEAIRIWKNNLDKEFLGVEECPICYSIIHTTNHSLPRLACKTCKHKFHSACLYKWFSTSHKSTCPLCQTPF